MVTYADIVRLEHVLIVPIVLENLKREVEAMCKEGRVEPKFIIVVTSMGNHDVLYLMMATLGEVLLLVFSQSSTRFLFDNNVLEVKVNQVLVKRETKFLQKHTIVAYFVGGHQTKEALDLWVCNLQIVVGDWVGLGHDLRRVFFQVVSKNKVLYKSCLCSHHIGPTGNVYPTNVDTNLHGKQSNGPQNSNLVYLEGRPIEGFERDKRGCWRLG